MKAEASFTTGNGLWEHLGTVRVKRSEAHRHAEKLLAADPDRFAVRLTVNRSADKPLLEFTAIRPLHTGR